MDLFTAALLGSTRFGDVMVSSFSRIGSEFEEWPSQLLATKAAIL
jgi:hypothetical protein